MTYDTFFPLLLCCPKPYWKSNANNENVSCRWERSLQMDTQMQPHWGHATAVLGSGLLFLQAWYFWSRSWSHFSSKLRMPLCMVILQALWSVARVYHPKVGMLHSPRDAFRPSLNLFSGHVMFCTPVASSEMKTTFTRCVIHLNHMSNLMYLFFHDEYPNAWQVSSLQHFCVWGITFPEDAHNLAKAVEVKLLVFSAACYIVLKSHSHRARKKWQLPYALIKFSA